MKIFFSILKKELRDVFTTPMIYILAGIFSLIMGWLFYNLIMNAQSMSEMDMTNSVLRPVLGNINIMMMIFIPLLTMRCFSLELKTRTLDLYVMNNTPWSTIFWAKFFATLLSTLFLILPTLIFPIVLAMSGYSDWGVVILSYIGVLFGQCGFIAIGLFASALTSNMIIAAIISFSILVGILLLVLSASVSGNYIIGQMVSYLSFPFHYQSFSVGLLRSYDLMYYASIVVLFYYLTVRILDRRKW